MDIAQLGYKVDSSELARGTVQLDKHTVAAGRTETATAKFDRKVQQLALSEKQLIAAQRQLPMQFTDIFTSIQAGQSPMQVLLQQGGQLKDVFGGIGPALRASAGYIMGLVNPFTVAAGAAIGLAVAWRQVEERQNSIDRALIRTGRYTEAFAEDLRDLSREMDEMDGVTAGSASRAIAQVAATGRFTQEQLQVVARATETWRAATGDAVEDVVKDFAKLKDDPVKSAIQLNRVYGFLTESTLDQARALEEEGREVEAADLLIRALASTIESRAPQMADQISTLGAAMRGVKSGATEMWDSFVEGLDRAATALRDKSPGMIGSLLRLATGGASRAAAAAGQAGPIVDSDAAEAAIEAAAEAQRKFDGFRTQSLTKALKLEKDIREMREAGVRLGKQEVELARVESEMRARAAERGTKRKETDPTDALIKRLREQIALNQEQAKAEDQLTATERMLVQVRTELERIGAKGSATNRAVIASLVDQARATDAAAQAAERKRVADEALMRLQERIGLAETNRTRSNQIDLMGMGRGSEATEMLRRQLDLHRWYEDEVVELRRQAAREKREVTIGEEAALKESLRRQLDEERAFQEQRRSLMGNWKVGANQAVEEYLERSRNIAGQTAEVWSEAFGAIEDIGVDALSNSLGSWEDYFDSLHKMILRFLIRQQLTKWMSMLFPTTSGFNPANYSDSTGLSGMGDFSLPAQSGAQLQPAAAAQPTVGASGGNVYLSVENNGAPATARTEQEQRGGDMFIRLILDKAEDRMATSMAAGGKLHTVTKQTFGLQRHGFTKG